MNNAVFPCQTTTDQIFAFPLEIIGSPILRDVYPYSNNSQMFKKLNK